MTPDAVLAALYLHGAALIVEEDRLRVRGTGEPLPDDMREGLREHRVARARNRARTSRDCGR